MRVFYGVAAAAAIAFISLPALLIAAPDKLRKAPTVSFKTLDGRTVKLAEHKGRIVVIDFWASWCAPCKATFPALNALAAEMQEQGVDVLAVSEDEKRKNLDAFLAAMKPSIGVLIDARGDAAAAFDVTAIPSMFIIDQDGAIRFSHPNYSAEVLASIRTEIASLAVTSRRNPSAERRD